MFRSHSIQLIRDSAHPIIGLKSIRPPCTSSSAAFPLHGSFGGLQFSSSSSRDKRGNEEAIGGGHNSEVFRKGIEDVLTRLDGVRKLRVIGIAGPEPPGDGRLMLFDGWPRSPFSTRVPMDVRNGAAKCNEPHA